MNFLEKNLPQYHTAQDKSQIHCPPIKLESLQQEAGVMLKIKLLEITYTYLVR
jgi:hypothetical protein